MRAVIGDEDVRANPIIVPSVTERILETTTMKTTSLNASTNRGNTDRNSR